MKNPATWLTACGSYICSNLSYTLGTDMFLGILPMEPYTCVSLIATGGPRIPGSPNEFSGLQVVIRDPNPAQALTRVESIHALFDNKWCVVSTVFPGRFYATAEPGAHIFDDNGHAVYSLNYVFAGVR